MGVCHLLLVLALLGAIVPVIPAKYHRRAHGRRNQGTSKGKAPGLPGDPANSVARIMKYREGMLCSGIHLKPWILLGVADCVKNQDKKDLYVIVKVPGEYAFNTEVEVGINEITYDPFHVPGQPEHNWALIEILGQFNWTMMLFSLPRINRSPDELVRLNIPTYIYFWETKSGDDDKEYTLVRGNANVTHNYTKGCGAFQCNSGWYCVATEPDNPTDWVQGYPLFIYMGHMVRCLGVYTNFVVDKSAPDHLFLNVYPSIDWIEEYVYEHPFPPV